MIHLFFPTSISEAKEATSKINRLPKTDSFSIISNNPQTNLFLADRQLTFKDSGEFFPAGKKLRTRQLKITSIAKFWAKSAGISNLLKYREYQLDDIVSFSLFIYLAEIEHSLLVAENILKNVNPDVVHVSQQWTESPFRRYQTEELNLENIALEGLSRLNHIQVNLLSPKTDISLHIKDTLQIAAKFINPLLQLKTSLRASNGSMTISPLVILANYYQLINLFPFISKLKTDNVDFTAIGKTDPTQLKLLNESGIPFFPIGSTQNASSAIQTIRYVYLWHKLQHQIMNSFNARHLLYWNLIKEKLRYLFTVEFPQITGYLDQAEEIFSRKPKALLTMATNDTFSRSFVETAIRQKTKVIELQHGLVVFDEEAPFRKNDIHAIWGEPVIKIMNQGNRQHKSFAVTGFPYFDKYKNIKTLKHKKIKTPTILILATFPVAADRLIATASPYQFMKIIFNAVKSQKGNWKIIFRPHPSCNAAWVQKMAETFSCQLFYDQRSIPIEQAILSCDAIISNFTSAIIDAMFIGKPIFLFPFADDNSLDLDKHPLITSGAVTVFRSSEELENLLTKISQDRVYVDKMKTGQKKFLKSYCSIDGEFSSEKLLTLIDSQLRN